MPVTITSKNHGFRRAGIAHGREPKTYPDGFFTEDQVAALMAEPMLSVVISPASPEREGEGVPPPTAPCSSGVPKLPATADDPPPPPAAAKPKNKSK